MAAQRVLVAWSSGKDSAWALHLLCQQSGVEVVGLLTTFNETADRVAMHAVRRTLVEAQARAAGVPLWPVFLPWPCSNTQYEERMRAALKEARRRGVTHAAFGDLFLEDVRRYRVRMLAASGIEPLFPLWCSPAKTPELAAAMLEQGLGAILTCVDPKQLPGSFLGRTYDADLLRDLPPGVDPCGERGEFHTFAWTGPMFSHPIRVRRGEVRQSEGFLFADLTPTSPKN